MSERLADLLAQRATLNDAIEKAEKIERSNALEKARELIAVFNLTAKDIGLNNAKHHFEVRKPLVAKYRDPESGLTWAGRGKAPKWIRDKDRESFRL
ncbi:H-NS histone family protein [Robbsia sp. KACC 23696]|uniref:H-NS histone family protein n=1 Tax=Robbsia sp. KACC 23696 TaxID=3149231 RepID=UPI00325B6FB5